MEQATGSKTLLDRAKANGLGDEGESDRARNRTKMIVASLEKDFRACKEPAQLFEFWKLILEDLLAYEKSRRGV